MGGINSAREKAVGLRKQITILENRLEKQYVKYNEVGGGGPGPIRPPGSLVRALSGGGGGCAVFLTPWRAWRSRPRRLSSPGAPGPLWRARLALTPTLPSAFTPKPLPVDLRQPPQNAAGRP
jgi:hypothetical protein